MHECLNLQHMDSPIRKGPRHKVYPSYRRHFGVSNAGFMDGHVQAMDPVSLSTLAVAWQDQMKPAFRDRWRKGPGKVKGPGD